MADRYVLDASVIVSAARNEPRWLGAAEILQQGGTGELHVAITAASLGEPWYVLARRSGEAAARRAVISVRASAIEVVPIDAELALQAVRLKHELRLGFLDAMVGALALQRDAALVTADSDFLVLRPRVAVQVLE